MQKHRETAVSKKAFSGDLLHELPKGKIEPYRLWFEFLLYAYEAIPARVDKKFYEGWGDISDCKFDEWFKDNWKRLFAIPASVSIIDNTVDAMASLDEEGVILIKVRNSVPVRRQIADVTKALAVFRGVKKSAKKMEPEFIITSKRSMNLGSLRAMLKFLRLMQQYSDIEIATKSYFDWAEAWNKKIRMRKNDKRAEIHIPKPIEKFIEEMRIHEEEQQAKKKKLKKSVHYNNARNDMRHFHRRAEKVVLNVARGQFPGEY